MLRLALTDDLYLRLLEPHDAEELYAVIDANRAHLSRWLPWAADQKLSDTREFIGSTLRQLASNDGLKVAIIEHGHIVGVAGFHHVDWVDRSTTIGYWLAEAAEGRGIMTKVVHALVDHAFGPWRLHRVEIQTALQNARSQAVPRRLGFTREGVRRDAERIGERYLDGVIYGIVNSEWPPDVVPGITRGGTLPEGRARR